MQNSRGWFPSRASNCPGLFKARELVRDDPGKASLLIGLEKGFYEILSRTSIEDLRQLTASPLLVYRPRFSLAFWRESVKNEKQASLPLRIQALLMAANEAAEQ